MSDNDKYGYTNLTVTLDGTKLMGGGSALTFTCESPKHGGFHNNWLLGLDYHVTEDEATPKRIVRNGPALVVFWRDGTKTVVKCHDEDFDAEKGLGMALARKLWGRSKTVKLLKTVEEQDV